MKKGIGILLLGLVLLLGACGTDSVKDTNIKTPFKKDIVQVDPNGKAKLTGKTEKGAQVTLEGKSVNVKKDGSFNIEMSNDSNENKDFDVEVSLQDGHWNLFTVAVKPPINNIAQIPSETKNFITKYNTIVSKKGMTKIDENADFLENTKGGYLQLLLNDVPTGSRVFAYYDDDFNLTEYAFSGGDNFYGFYMLTALSIEKDVPYYADYMDWLISQDGVFSKEYETNKYIISATNASSQLMSMNIKLK
ncbi:hypothetical protein V9L40_002105 [Listeria monocytogenes]